MIPHVGTSCKGQKCPTGVLSIYAQVGHQRNMVPNYLGAWRKHRDLSQDEVAAAIGTTKSMYGKLERSERTLDTDWLEKIARAVRCEPYELISTPPGSAVVRSSEALSIARAPDLPITRSADAGEAVEIIQLDLSLPMGPGATVDDYIEEEPRLFDLAYIRSFTRTPPSRLRLARGVGDSMFPTLLSNDLVWIDSTQTQLNQSDRIWAVSINGGAAIKRLRPLKGGGVMVMSDNPGPGHESYEVGRDEIMIGGRVIRFARDL